MNRRTFVSLTALAAAGAPLKAAAAPPHSESLDLDLAREVTKVPAIVVAGVSDRGAALYAWVFRQLTREDPAAFYWT